MTATCACQTCKFADKKALATWDKGKHTPYCTHPTRQMDTNGDCQSGRQFQSTPPRGHRG